MRIATLCLILLLGTGLVLGARTLSAQEPEAMPDPVRLVPPIGHGFSPAFGVISSDGKYVLSGADNSARLWEVGTRRLVRVFQHSSFIQSGAFSPDGKFAVTGSSDKTARVWNLRTGEPVLTLNHDGWVMDVAYTSDGSHLLTTVRTAGIARTQAHLWRVSDGQHVKDFQNQTLAGGDVAISPNGKYVLTGSHDCAQLWSVEKASVVHTLTVPDWVTSLAFSPDSSRVATASGSSQSVQLWDVETGRSIRTFEGHTKHVQSLAFSHDGRYLVTGSFDLTARLWEVETGRQLQIYPGHPKIIAVVAFSPDDTQILTNGDLELWFWNRDSGKKAAVIRGSTQAIRKVAFSQNQKYATAACNDGTVRLWETTTGKQTALFAEPDFLPIADAVLSDNHKYLLTGTYGKACLWNVSTGSKLHTFPAEQDWAWSVDLSSDGRYAATPDGKKARLWNTETGAEFHVLDGHPDTILQLAFSPDGKYLATSAGEVVFLWEVATGVKVRSMVIPPDPARPKAITPDVVLDLDFSPDGSKLAGGTMDHTTCLWEVESGRVLHRLEHSAGSTHVSQFSPDGKFLVSASGTRVRLWETDSGRPVRTFEGHDSSVNSACFNSSGKLLLTSSDDGTVRMWETASAKQLFTYLPLDTQDWVVFTADGRFDGSPGGMQQLSFARGLETFSLEQFADRFFTPNLVGYVLHPEPDAPTVVPQIQQTKLPPTVRIVSPAAGEVLTGPEFKVAVEITDRGGGIDEVRLYQNGKLVSSESRTLMVAPDRSERVTRTFALQSLAGVNVIRATAFNRDRVESAPAQVTVEFRAAEPQSDLWLLGVGISEYRNPDLRLRYSRKDAETLLIALEGKARGIFRSVHKKLVLDEQATREGIEAAFAEVIRGAQPGDAFVFYYSGHGVMTDPDEDRPGDFHLGLTDVVRFLDDQNGVVQRGISATRLRQLCTAVRANKQMLILDACQSGGAVEAFATRGAAEEKAIYQLARSAGIAVLAASLSQQDAAEYRELGHGVFTYALLQALNGRADRSPTDGKITVTELKAYLDDQVPELVKKHRGQVQYPTGFIRGQDFPVTVQN